MLWITSAPTIGDLEQKNDKVDISNFLNSFIDNTLIALV